MIPQYSEKGDALRGISFCFENYGIRHKLVDFLVKNRYYIPIRRGEDVPYQDRVF